MPEMAKETKIAVAAAVAAGAAVIITSKTGKIAVCLKAGAAVAAANPVAIGACVAVCVGLIVYKIVKTKQKKQKEKEYEYSSRGDTTTRSYENNFHYDPDTKSITDSAAPVAIDSNSNLRKRHVNRSDSSARNGNKSEKSAGQQSNIPNNLSEKSSDKKSILIDHKEVQTDVNWNVNEEKILPDKNLSPMSSEEKVCEFLSRNIQAADAEESECDTMSGSELSDASCWSNISSVKSTDDSERKKYKKKVYRSFKKYVAKNFPENYCLLSAEKLDENSDILSSSSGVSGSNRNNISSGESQEDVNKTCKKKVHLMIKEFVEDMYKTKTSGPPSECSITSIESTSSYNSILAEEPEMCIACKENPPSSRVQPCNHRYMCSDCAMKFFELYKKCKMCRAKIEKVVVED